MPESSSILQSIDEEDSLWNGPNAPGWVACNQRNKTCYGKIAKSAWYNPATRASVCTQAFNEQARLGNVKAVAEGLDTCNLNNKMDELCRALQGARTLVMEANCIFAGVCAPQVFVYTPATYSSSNQDFVRGTVTSFYEMFRQVAARRDASGETVDDSDGDEFYAFLFNKTLAYDELVCPLDDMELQLKVLNDALKSTCSATQFNGLKEVLCLLRKIVNTIVMISYSLMQMIVCLFRLLVPVGGEAAIQSAISEMTFWFNKIIVLMAGAIVHLANALFNLIFSLSELGKALKKAVEGLCKLANFVLWIWNNTACEWVFKPLVVPALRFLATLTGSIMSFFR
jgi:hypothetical protein